MVGKCFPDTGDRKGKTEWCIQGKVFFKDEDGEIDYEYVEATVYNWKTGGSKITGEYQWHVGGTIMKRLILLMQLSKAKSKTFENRLSYGGIMVAAVESIAYAGEVLEAQYES